MSWWRYQREGRTRRLISTEVSVYLLLVLAGLGLLTTFVVVNLG